MTKVSTLILGTLLAGTLSHLGAEETIDEQISTIQNAPAQQRVELMNRFKQKMASMNEEERIKATNRLRQQLQVKDQSATGIGSQVQTRMQQQNMQQQSMNPMQPMNQMQQQRMNQMQQQNNSPMQNMQTGGGTMQGGKR